MGIKCNISDILVRISDGRFLVSVDKSFREVTGDRGVKKKNETS